MIRKLLEIITISAEESLGYYEMRKHKPWLDKGWTKLSDKSKQAKLQQLQIFNENADNLKAKFNELPMNNTHKNIRDLQSKINYFTRGYQHCGNLVKDENGDLLADSYIILNRRTTSLNYSM
jgi:hypothetical protein